MLNKRILSFLLAVMLIVGLMPTSVFASEIDADIYCDGEAVKSVSFPSNKSVDISVESVDGCDGYQWQIKVPGSDVWANIYGEDGRSISLSQALIANMLDGGTARIRCAMVVSGEDVYTDSISVTTTEAEHEEVDIPDYVPAPAPVNEGEGILSEPVVEDAPEEVEVSEEASEENSNESEENMEEEEMEEEKPSEEPVMKFRMAPRAVAELPSYTIKINYLFEDGSLAAQSWEGTFTAGTSYALEVASPTVNGYVADTAKIEEVFDSIDADKTFTVTYSPTHVKYVVKHQQQNVNNDDYTEVTADRKEHNDKYANDSVGTGHANSYKGFKTLDYDDSTAIAADGSTVLNIYYDRLYYLMSFDLDGGYGVQPIYARYGTAIPQNLSPKKPGYAFTGWDKSIPSTMPAENTSYTASWKAGSEVNVNLVFWYENANDSEYTYVGSATSTATYVAGAKVKPSDFQNVSFTGRDNYHFKFNDSMNTAVDLNADGSTIVNIYFKRNTYRMIFFNCRQSGHVSDEYSCYPNTRAEALNYVKGLSDRVDTELNPSGNWIWGISIYTRKWQQDVRPDWEAGIANRSNTRRWRPYEVHGAEGQLIYNGDLNVSTMNVMPDADIVFRFLSTGTIECTMNYWITPITGESTSGATKKVDDGVEYILRNQVVTMMGGITEKEEYVDIEGFTKVYTWSQLANKGYRTSGSGTATAHFFYKRNSYDLAYISNGATVNTEKIEFEGIINGISKNNKDYKPPYPAEWEPDAYEFKGWYLSENCDAGTEVNWDMERMPVGGVSVYAKWEPVSHTVTVKTEENGTTTNTYTVAHSKTVTNPPADPTKDGYSFISWFYRDATGAEQPFTFEMPIVEDLILYPKWKQEAIVNGVLSFELEDGTKVADDSPVQALVGETKTYDAKANDDLFPAYQEGYFPREINHSITFDVNSENAYTFVYVAKDYVNYTVKYLEAGTNKELAEDKNATSTNAAVVENFKPIAGYIPDLYKKTLLLSINEEENVLTFWYTKDGEHAPILRGHYLQNADDDEYTTYQEVIDGYGIIGETYSEAPMTTFEGTDINGFTLNAEISKQSGTLTSTGLELKLYYDRNLYPYVFHFVDENGKELADSITGTAKFEATVEQEVLEIPGYSLIPDNEIIDTNKKEIQIAIENGETATVNVKTFVYKAEFADLTITKTGANTVLDPNQVFVFKVSGKPVDTKLSDVDMTVTICGNGNVVIQDLPVGSYTVTEVVDWSWRYELATGSANPQNVQLMDPENGASVTFKNERKNDKWLSDEAYADNIFGEVN